MQCYFSSFYQGFFAIWWVFRATSMKFKTNSSEKLVFVESKSSIFVSADEQRAYVCQWGKQLHGNKLLETSLFAGKELKNLTFFSFGVRQKEKNR